MHDINSMFSYSCSVVYFSLAVRQNADRPRGQIILFVLEGELCWEWRVVVGKKSRATPSLRSEDMNLRIGVWARVMYHMFWSTETEKSSSIEEWLVNIISIHLLIFSGPCDCGIRWHKSWFTLLDCFVQVSQVPPLGRILESYLSTVAKLRLDFWAFLFHKLRCYVKWCLMNSSQRIAWWQI